jgi:uroporphyrinogen decarboxylase
MTTGRGLLHKLVLASEQPRALPIATYPGLSLTGAKVSDIVTSPAAQRDAQAALRARYQTPFALSAMDLSAEAEAFGCEVALSESEIPTVTGRLVTTLEEARRLAVPKPGDKRTRVYLETVGLLAKLPGEPFVLGGCIGPFSLAARFVGVSEAMELTMTEPELMATLLEKATSFLGAYVAEFKAAGARGVIMAEPAAGLLSPRAMSQFSSVYIRRIGELVNDGDFTLILHNCAAKLLHLPAILGTGLGAFHFGAPMDMAAALGQVAGDMILCGNLDPAGVFVQLPPEQVHARVTGLLELRRRHPNFVISSGCDLPPNAPLAGLDALFRAVAEYRGWPR